jgi:hypothetical protein
MIFRLSQKLLTKIKEVTLRVAPLDDNPFADWSAHLFIAGRARYILLSNTKSLYSKVMYGKGITSGGQLESYCRYFISSGSPSEHPVRGAAQGRSACGSIHKPLRSEEKDVSSWVGEANRQTK